LGHESHWGHEGEDHEHTRLDVTRSPPVLTHGIVEIGVPGLVAAIAEARSLAGVRKRPSSAASSAPPNGWDNFDAEVITHPMTGQTRFLFAEAAGAICRIEEKGAAGESDTAALADDDAGKALAVALAHVVAHKPALVRALRDDVLPGVHLV
jgi:hypothetical protein